MYISLTLQTKPEGCPLKKSQVWADGGDHTLKVRAGGMQKWSETWGEPAAKGNPTCSEHLEGVPNANSL